MNISVPNNTTSKQCNRNSLSNLCLNGGIFAKTTTIGRWIFLILSLIVPFLYLSMYFPVWNGKELLLVNSGTLGIVLFVFQCVSLLFAILCLCFAKLRNSDSCLLSLFEAIFFVASLAITCFCWFFFIWELLNVPWFPAQR